MSTASGANGVQNGRDRIWSVPIVGGDSGRVAFIATSRGRSVVVIYPPRILPNMAMTPTQARRLIDRLVRAVDRCEGGFIPMSRRKVKP